MTQKDTGTLSGGTITIDGIVVTVPDNLLATLPSITVAWSELFQGGIPNLPGTGSWQATVGLASNFYLVTASVMASLSYHRRSTDIWQSR